jgi:GT2 family glycosyltransferase
MPEKRVHSDTSMSDISIVVGIPTVGRAAVLCETLRELACQTRRPDRIVVCGSSSRDVAGVDAVAPQALVLLTEAGLPRQRNAILDAAGDADIVVFFDDDFLPRPNYLEAVARHMAAHPKTVVATGLVLADGIKGPGLSPAEARAVLAQDGVPDAGIAPVFNGYGCNMAVRLAPMRAHDLRFDERLSLYGWQEDVDLSRRLGAFGDIVRIGGARGVHLGVKSGRGSGLRLGYSQIANPIYLTRKRRGYRLDRAVTHIACNMAMNVVRSFWPEPYIDRRGRLSGNLVAMRDLLRGRLAPERILEL